MSGMINVDSQIQAMCRRSFKFFVRHFWSHVPGTQPLAWNWHMTFICNELQAVAERVFRNEPKEHNLIINVSPGTSKSSLCSILFPCWLWTRMAHARILTASHADDLVLDLSNKARYVLKCDEYKRLFPEIVFRDDQDTKGYYANTSGGDRYTCTVSGKSPMGFHAHFLIVDDAIDPKKASSEVELKTAQDFFDNVLPSRTVDRLVSVTILIMQRLHVMDPTGHMLKKTEREGAAKVRHLKMPAEIRKFDDGTYDEERVLPPEIRHFYTGFNEDAGMPADGLMDPKRLARQALKERLTDGILAYSGQYLQEPTVLGGGMFKDEYFNLRCKAAPYNCRRVRYWDRASTGSGGARTAGVLLARSKDNRYFVEHVVAGQWEPTQRNAIMKATALKDRARYGPSHEPVIWVEREGGSSGKDAFQGIARLLAGFHVKEHNITGMGKKAVRAEPWSSQLAAGNVWLVDNGESTGNGKADWDLEDYINEHVLFPNGLFLDCVDASSGGFACLVKAPDTLGVRILSSLKRVDDDLQINVVPRDELTSLSVKERALLIDVQEPSPVGVGVLPEHSISELEDTILLQFADTQPEEHQDEWGQAIVPYNKPVEEIVLTAKQAKDLWAFVFKKRSRTARMIIIVDDGTRKALSIARALRELLVPKKPLQLSVDEDKGVNKYVYQVTKRSRNLVY
jgi:hypothetical protein